MNFTLTARDKRALRLGGIILVPLALYFLVLEPLTTSIGEQRARAEQERMGLEREQIAIERSKNFDRDWADASQWLTHEHRRLFHGDDEIAATSDLAEYVAQQARSAGVTLRQTETRPLTSVSGTLNAVQLSVRAEGTNRAVMSFLEKLEGGNRLVRMGRLTLTPTTLATPRSTSTAPVRSSAPVQQTIRTAPTAMSDLLNRFQGQGTSRRGGQGRFSQGQGGGRFSQQGWQARQGMQRRTMPQPAQPQVQIIQTPQVAQMPSRASQQTQQQRGLAVTADVYGYTMLPPPPELELADASPGASYRVRGPASLPVLRVADAIANDPFSPDRGKAPPTPPTIRQRSSFPIQLVGTVIVDADAFAVCKIGDAPVVNVWPGQQIAGYTLREIRRGMAVFADANGHTTRLVVPSPRI